MFSLFVFLTALLFDEGTGLQRPEVEYKVFQFPANQIPRNDGNSDDWAIVPESYSIGMNKLRETVAGLGDKRDSSNLDVKVKVGWVQGQNHLYFLYEASDNSGDESGRSKRGFSRSVLWRY